MSNISIYFFMVLASIPPRSQAPSPGNDQTDSVPTCVVM